MVCCPRSVFAADKVITDADKGRTIHLKVGGDLRIAPGRESLDRVHVVPGRRNRRSLLKLVHQTQTEATEPGVGRPVFQVFKFEAKQRYGEGVLHMHYVRSWEPPAPEDEQFDLHVVVE